MSAATYGIRQQVERVAGDNSSVKTRADRIVGRVWVVEAMLALFTEAIRPQHREIPDILPGKQRQYPRRPAAVRARCSGDWGSSNCLISDLSEGGASLVCGHAPQVGEQVTLEFASRPNFEPMRLRCAVKYVSGSQTGVAFVEDSVLSKEQLAEMLQPA